MWFAKFAGILPKNIGALKFRIDKINFNQRDYTKKHAESIDLELYLWFKKNLIKKFQIFVKISAGKKILFWRLGSIYMENIENWWFWTCDSSAMNHSNWMILGARESWWSLLSPGTKILKIRRAEIF